MESTRLRLFHSEYMLHSPNKFNIQYTAIFSSPTDNCVRIWLSQPVNSETQKVESFSISPKPQNCYKDNF